MVEVRTEKLERAVSKIANDGKDIHISGEPGIGKTEFLGNLEARLPDKFRTEKIAARTYHEIDDLHRDLLHIVRREATHVDSKKNQLTGASGDLGPVGGSAEFDDRVRDIQKLQDLTTSWSGSPILLCIDDVQKIDDDPKIAREVVGEISQALCDGVYLATAGRLSSPNKVEEIHLNLYTIEETRRFLKAQYGTLPKNKAKDVHKAVEGHPLYLDLLSEISENEDDFELPPEEVREVIQRRYIESLPPEIQQFLRKVAPLPKLDEKTCSEIIEDRSPTQIAHLLRQLNQRAIVQQVNQTDEGYNIYKIHQHFRLFLLERSKDKEEVQRKAFQYHIRETTEKATGNNENSLRESIPHTFSTRYHLEQLYPDGVAPAEFRAEINKMDLDSPQRFLIMVYSGISILSDDAISLWEKELDHFEEWVQNHTETEQQAEFIVGILEWFISQFSDNPMQLSDVEVTGGIDDLPSEAVEIEEEGLPEAHAKRLQRSWHHILRFFLIEEPHQVKTHRKQMSKMMGMYGVSVELLSEFRDQVLEIVYESDLDNEFKNSVKQIEEIAGKELEGSLNSSLDYHGLRDTVLDSGQEAVESFHYDGVVRSGILREIALEGGSVLEEADNPAFAMFWYSFILSYVREVGGEKEIFGEIQDRYREQIEARQEYEESLDHVIIEASDQVNSSD